LNLKLGQAGVPSNHDFGHPPPQTGRWLQVLHQVEPDSNTLSQLRSVAFLLYVSAGLKRFPIRLSPAL